MYDPRALGLNVTMIVGDEAYCLCPFHDDSRQSASFNMRLGLFHCMGCGVSYKAASLAYELGADLEECEVPETALEKKDEQDWRVFLQFPLALDHSYLKKRNVSNDLVRRFRIFNTGRGVGFPIIDIYGKVVGFQERIVGSSYLRYLTFGTPYPWPYEHIKTKGEVYIVEGIFGVLNAARFGIKAVACLSAINGPRFINELSHLDGAILFDNDDAGYAGAFKTMIASKYKFGVLLPGAETDELNGDQWKIMQMREPSIDHGKILSFIKNESIKTTCRRQR